MFWNCYTMYLTTIHRWSFTLAESVGICVLYGICHQTLISFSLLTVTLLNLNQVFLIRTVSLFQHRLNIFGPHILVSWYIVLLYFLKKYFTQTICRGQTIHKSCLRKLPVNCPAMVTILDFWWTQRKDHAIIIDVRFACIQM